MPNEQRETRHTPQNSHRTTHDWTGSQSVAVTIQRAIVRLDPGHDPLSGEPLQSVVDVDALDRLFEPTGDWTRSGEANVSFLYDGYRITVSSDGTVAVREQSPGLAGDEGLE